MTTVLREVRDADRAALADVCIRTGDGGRDATLLYGIPTLLPDIFVLPYIERHPDFAFVVDVDGTARGYVVCAPDTIAFARWFAREWWPPRRPTELAPSAITDHDRAMLAYADAQGAEGSPYAAEYPAHLHVDLLPSVQRQGWGRRLIDALVERLRRRQVSGLHLITGAANIRAADFYRHLGFAPLPAAPGGRAFGMRLRAHDDADKRRHE